MHNNRTVTAQVSREDRTNDFAQVSMLTYAHVMHNNAPNTRTRVRAHTPPIPPLILVQRAEGISEGISEGDLSSWRLV